MRNSYLKAKIKAYREQIESGNLKSNTLKVVDYVRTHIGANTDSLDKDLGMLRQTLSPAVDNALNFGLIEEDGQIDIKKGDKTWAYTIYKYVGEEDRQIQLALDRHRTKFEDWAKRGIKEFDGFLDAYVLASLKSDIGYKEE